MEVLDRKLVGVIGSRAIGTDPFDRRSWSGISFYLFSELQRRNALQRAFGVEVAHPRRALLMLRQFHPRHDVWRRQFYTSPSYRRSLTSEVSRHLTSSDFDSDFLQLGALFDLPGIVAGRTRCFSYHDGNLAQSSKSPFARRQLSQARLREGLAFERAVYQGVDLIFTMSEYLKRSFVEDFGIPGAKVVNVGGGVNLDSFPEPFAGKKYDTKQVLFIGVEFERKGGPQLLAAHKRLREKHPGAVLHVVGPRTRPFPEQPGVVFHGYLHKTDPREAEILRTLFEKCSVFVLPSLYEPFGIAPLEAMLHEIPAIVSRGWALQENVQPGMTGEHVDPGAVDELTEKLVAALADPGKLMEMGQRARQYVLERHTWPRVIERMLSEIRRVQERSPERGEP
jgi:starch synthase